MINPKELRLGNWIKYLNDGYLFQVTTIEETGLGVVNKEESTWIEHDQFEPIPITQEVMEKCDVFLSFGFAENFTCECNTGDQYPIRVEQYSEGSEPIRHIQYLHQLQNLHYALTGNELTYIP